MIHFCYLLTTDGTILVNNYRKARGEVLKNRENLGNKD